MMSTLLKRLRGAFVIAYGALVLITAAGPLATPALAQAAHVPAPGPARAAGSAQKAPCRRPDHDAGSASAALARNQGPSGKARRFQARPRSEGSRAQPARPVGCRASGVASGDRPRH